MNLIVLAVIIRQLDDVNYYWNPPTIDFIFYLLIKKVHLYSISNIKEFNFFRQILITLLSLGPYV